MRFKWTKYLLNNYKVNTKRPSHNRRGKRNTAKLQTRNTVHEVERILVNTTPEHQHSSPYSTQFASHCRLVHWQQLTLWSGFYWPHPDCRVASAVPVEVLPEHSPGGGARERNKNTARNTPSLKNKLLPVNCSHSSHSSHCSHNTHHLHSWHGLTHGIARQLPHCPLPSYVGC